MRIFSLPKLVARKQRRVERVRLDQIKVEQDYLDQSIRIPQNAKKQVENKIRLCYVALDGFNANETGDLKMDTIFGSTCVFKLPEGMKLEDACKLVSYLSEYVEEKNDLEPASELSVQIVGSQLENYGFIKREKSDPDYSHSQEISDLDYFQKSIIVPTNNVVKKDIGGVVDLMTIGGDPDLFQRSDLSEKEFNWFTSGVKFEEVRQIYDNLGMQVNKNGVIQSKTRE